MGKIRISGRVPEDRLNGLSLISNKLIADPHGVTLAIVKLGVAEVRTVIHDPNDERHEDAEEQVPVVQLLAIEPITDDDEKRRALDVYKAAYYARTGDGETLPASVLQFPGVRGEEVPPGEPTYPAEHRPLDTRRDGGDEPPPDGEPPGDPAAGRPAFSGD